MIALDRGVPLARFTTVGTGGPARLFARPETLAELEQALAYADADGLAVVPIGLGSNVLVADEGLDALVLRLGGELAVISHEDDELRAGGGATNATCVHRARAAGLAGFEFASAIPGTVGGGVRMNAGAYGRDFAAVLVEATVVSSEGVRTLSADELGLAYRHSALGAADVVAGVRLRLTHGDPDAIKREAASLLAERKATQPTNRRTFGSVFKNPSDGPGAGALIERAGLKGFQIGGAIISPRHANFIENADGATSADAVALMAEARRRVRELAGVTLEPEVRMLGPIALPDL